MQSELLVFCWEHQEKDTVDRIDRMSTPQVVRILCEAYQNSKFSAATMSRIHEILQMVSF